MIAVPVDVPSHSSQPVSRYYGNVAYFALYDLQGQMQDIVMNEAKGSGEDISKYLSGLGVTHTLFRHLGDKLFDWLQKQSITAYALEQRNIQSTDAAKALIAGDLPLVDETNAHSLLDPSGKSQGCECDCAH